MTNTLCTLPMPLSSSLSRLLLFVLILWLAGCQQILTGADVPPTAVSASPTLPIQTATPTPTRLPNPTPSPTAPPPSVADAFEALSHHLQADLPFNAPALADALQGIDNVRSPTAVELREIAEILTQRSFDPAVLAAAEQLLTALEMAPSNAPDRPATSAAWLSLLENDDAHRATLRPPRVEIQNRQPEAAVNLLNPAYLGYQLTGQTIGDVRFFAGREVVEGQIELLSYEPVWPAPLSLPHGRELFRWGDGGHHEVVTWTAQAHALTDGVTAPFALLWAGHDPDHNHAHWVTGLYNTAVGESFPAELHFNQAQEGTLTAVWRLDGAEPSAYTPQAGDQFTPDQYYLTAEGQLSREAGGTTLDVFDPETGVVRLRTLQRALPDGAYLVGVEAGPHPTAVNRAITTLSVNNEASGAANSGLRGYLDPQVGFQFPYPMDWLPPQYREHGLYSANLDGTAQLQLTLYPNTAVSRPSELQAEVLTQFGTVDLLYEQDTAVGTNPAIPAILTAYGYRTGSLTNGNNQPEERTGLLLTFIHQQQGYVLDLDAPATAEPQAIAFIENIRRNWQFRPLEPPQFTRNWRPLNLPDLILPQRDDFRVQTAGAWERVTANDDPRIFVALQTRPREAQELSASLLRWSGVASQGVQEYAPRDPRRLALGTRLWLVQEFAYVGEGTGEEMRGVVLVSEEQGRELIVWAEAPAVHYDELFHEIVATMLAGLVVRE